MQGVYMGKLGYVDTLCREWQLPLYASLTLRCEGGKRGGGEAAWVQWAIRRG